MSGRLGNIEILTASCNLETVRDLRGGILTWLPDTPIVEVNMLYFRPGRVRGHHYHPEFIEYFMVVHGVIVMVTIDPVTGKEISMNASEGTCFKIPMNTPHAVYSITECTCVAMLSKQWDSCDPPIVRKEII
jgi:mannose-6-phosphate isomerase-like protein (cupin superfamily)